MRRIIELLMRRFYYVTKNIMCCLVYVTEMLCVFDSIMNAF
jgi:hypothetical protein